MPRSSRIHPVRVILLLFLFLLVIALVVGWILLPTFLAGIINKRLGQVPGYDAHVASAGFNPALPAVWVDGFSFRKKHQTAPATFMDIDRIYVAAQWGDIFRRRWDVDIALERPRTEFLMRQRRPDQPRKFGLWQKFFQKWPGFHIGKIAIRNAAIHVRNDEDIPPTDLYFDKINGFLTNMANRKALLSDGPSHVEGKGRMLGHAAVEMKIDVEPFKEHATFHLFGRLENFKLASMNYVLNHYTGVDLSSGTLNLTGDLTALDGSFHGLVSRRIEHAAILQQRREHLGFIQKAKEFLFAAWVKHKLGKDKADEGQFQLSGPLGYMDADVFLACVWTAKSAFLQSFRPDVQDKVEMGTPDEAEEEWMALQAREREKKNRKSEKASGKNATP